VFQGSYETHASNFITFQPNNKISRSVLWVCSIFSWLRTRSLTTQVNIFFSAGTSWSSATCESVDYTGVSELLQQPGSLLMLLFVDHLLEIHLLTPLLFIPSADTNF